MLEECNHIIYEENFKKYCTMLHLICFQLFKIIFEKFALNIKMHQKTLKSNLFDSEQYLHFILFEKQNDTVM